MAATAKPSGLHSAPVGRCYSPSGYVDLELIGFRLQSTDDTDVESGRTVQHRQAFLTEVYERGAPIDLLVLAFVPLTFIAAFALPASAKQGLMFVYTNPTLLAAFANHFVHLSVTHLLGNLIGYGLVVPTAYLLSVVSGQRRQFFIVFATFLLALPFALSALNLVFVRPRIGIGASGLIMAFVGYLPVPLTAFARSRLGVPASPTQSSGLFFLGLALVAYVAAPATYGMPLAVAAGLAGVLFLLPVIEETTTEAVSLPGAGYTEVAVFGMALFIGYPLVAFPRTVATSGSIVNVYSHVLGFCFGYIVTYVGVQIGVFD